jgi:NADPH-dependent 2,4-dienoyl-CoA reductase/sulfur reductase-like enzyme
MNPELAPVIVGAGPAGIRAAQTLARHGVRPVVIDEAASWGGQIYRQPPANFQRSGASLYGFEASRATAVHRAMTGVLERVDYRPRTLVWSAEAGELDVLHRGRTSTVPYSHLVVATGATDRVLPFPGWTIPGVFTIGGAQVALKYQGCAIGTRVVFLGTGPLLYAVAYQYAKAGAEVMAVLDTTGLGPKLAAAPALLRRPAVLAKGIYYLAWLRVHGIALHEGVRPVRVLGTQRVAGVVWNDGHHERELACDAIGFGYALRSETQLADILGCGFTFDPLQRAYRPGHDVAGRSSVPGVYLAGDGAGILGADAAEWAGERAALALLEDAGVPVDGARAATLERRLARIAAFGAGLERAFPFPAGWAAGAADDLIICRCEEITAGDLRGAVKDAGAHELNRLKALTRVGMGRCQGRVCGLAAAEILAHASGREPRAVGRLRSQAPIKPIPFTVVETGPEKPA